MFFHTVWVWPFSCIQLSFTPYFQVKEQPLKNTTWKSSWHQNNFYYIINFPLMRDLKSNCWYHLLMAIYWTKNEGRKSLMLLNGQKTGMGNILSNNDRFFFSFFFLHNLYLWLSESTSYLQRKKKKKNSSSTEIEFEGILMSSEQKKQKRAK